MIYLSANGVVLGQFAESALPAMLAEGTVTNDAYFWRVGMSEWRPVAELAMPPVPEAALARPALPKLVPAPAPAKAAGTDTPAQTALNLPQVRDRIGSAPPGATETPKVVVEIRAADEGEGATKFAAELYRAYRRWAEAQGLQVESGTSVSSAKGGFKQIAFKITGDAAPSAAPEANKSPIPQRSVLAKNPLTSKLAIPERKAVAAPPAVGEGNKQGAAQAASDAAVNAPPPGLKPSFSPRVAPQAPAESPARSSSPLPGPEENFADAPAATEPPRRKVWPAVVLWLLLLAAAGGGGAWWWMNKAPSSIPGKVLLSGDETGPAKIRVYRRADLAVPWREQLAVADARAGELDSLVAEAEAELREKTLLHDEAARVCQVGEEFNMPDVAKLRADRDAKKADVDAAQAKLDQIKGERDGLVAVGALLESAPAPLQTIAADAAGNFAVPASTEGEIVFLATVSAEVEGRPQMRGWLEILDLSESSGVPFAVEFSDANLLDLQAIRNFVADAGP